MLADAGNTQEALLVAIEAAGGDGGIRRPLPETTKGLLDAARTNALGVLAVFEGHSGAVTDVAFSPDGSLITAATLDTTVRVWDVSGNLVASLEDHPSPVFRVVFSHDGSSIAAASADGSVRLWDVSSRNPIRSLEGHSSFILDIAFSPDSSSIVTCSHDGTALLWDAGSGKPIAALEGHADTVVDVAFSLNGSFIATAYRYFPSQAALVHAVVDEALGPILDWRSGSNDVEQRVQDLIGTSMPRIIEFEATFRAALKLSLEPAGADEPAEPRFTRGHRVDLLRDAVRPLTGKMPAAEADRLAQALSLIYGIEMLVVLKDIWGLGDKAAVSVMEWAAQSLVRAAISAEVTA